MTIAALGMLGLALICAWVFGGFVLRIAGGVLALAGLLGLSLNGDASGILAFALGACLWLGGHLHFRLRHGAFESALAELICLGAAFAYRFAGAISGGSEKKRCVASAAAISGYRGRCGTSLGAAKGARAGGGSLRIACIGERPEKCRQTAAPANGAVIGRTASRRNSDCEGPVE